MNDRGSIHTSSYITPSSDLLVDVTARIDGQRGLVRNKLTTLRPDESSNQSNDLAKDGDDILDNK